jgi:putative hemin transport protein
MTIHTTTITTPNQSLSARWRSLRQTRPHLRIRDAAEELGVSELELRATEIGTQPAGECGATRLRSESIRTMLGELERLGEIMALTRNAWAVHEKIGPWTPLQLGSEFGLVLGEHIDLRLFMSHWTHAIAVSELIEHGPGAGDLRHSLHFFDASGEALHKVYVREPEGVAEFIELVDRHRSDDQRPWQQVEPRPEPAEPLPDEAIAVPEFHAAWLALHDTHEFFPMLRRFSVGRTQALRLAPPEHAFPVACDSITKLLRSACDAGTSIMVFVGNRGCLQIHTGPVHRIMPLGPWINVMDPDFNLHLRTDAVAEAWVVRKPTDDGIVTSLELFDSAGETIALLFGARKPGIPEQDAWRERIAELEPLPR